MRALRLPASIPIGIAAALLLATQPASSQIVWTFDPAHLVPEPIDEVSVGLAFDFNRGDFELDERNDTLSLQPAVRMQSANVSVRAVLPFYWIEGRFDPVIDPPRETEFGVGDLTLDLAYTLYPVIRGGPFFDFTTRLKIPTAEDLFGTGEFDATFLISAYQRLPLQLAVIGEWGYRVRGGGLYEDTHQAAVIVGSQGGNGIGIWLAYDWRESPLPGLRKDEHEITPFLSIPIGARLRYEPYAVIGLSEGSPDWGVGSSIWWKF